MNVAEQIEVFQAAIDKLKALDPNTPMAGHVSYPDGCYSGDLDHPIYKISVENLTEEELRAEEPDMSDEDIQEIMSQYSGVTLGVYTGPKGA